MSHSECFDYSVLVRGEGGVQYERNVLYEKDMYHEHLFQDEFKVFFAQMLLRCLDVLTSHSCMDFSYDEGF